MFFNILNREFWRFVCFFIILSSAHSGSTEVGGDTIWEHLAIKASAVSRPEGSILTAQLLSDGLTHKLTAPHGNEIPGLESSNPPLPTWFLSDGPEAHQTRAKRESL